MPAILKPLAFDTECYYDDEVSVKPLGAWTYARHPKADHYMLTVADETERWSGRPETFNWETLRGRLLVAHNSSYDSAILGALVEQGKAPAWVLENPTGCTADLAAFLQSGRSLLEATQTLTPDLVKPIDKKMRTFMKGRSWQDAVDAGKSAALTEYALNDAVACFELWNRHADKWPAFEQQLSQHTRLMCDRGLAVDEEKVGAALRHVTKLRWDAEQKIPWACDSATPLSAKHLALACSKAGIVAPASLAEDSPECEAWEAKYGQLFEWVGAMRDWRKTNTLLKKLQTLHRRLRPDGSFAYGLKYFGAHTGRWSGESGFNVQNLPRDPAYGVDLRGCFVARPGHTFVTCDLSQIEPRVLAWLSGDHALLNSIKNGMAIYEAHARNTMRWTGGRLKDENKTLYSLAKARCLGLGFGCGPGKFIQVAKNLAGLELSAEEAERTVKEFRASNPKIMALWNRLDQRLRASRGGSLEMELPNGRTLRQYQVLARDNSYWTINTIKGNHRKTWGGSLTENCISGDTEVLAEGRGWVALKAVRSQDKVWDGEAFVPHEGLINKGYERTIMRFGVSMTPDHLLLTESGWVGANKTCPAPLGRLASGNDYNQTAIHTSPETTSGPPPGAEIPTPDRTGEGGDERKEHLVGNALRLWDESYTGGEGSQTGATGRLRERLPFVEAAPVGTASNPRAVEDQTVCGLALYESPLPEPSAPGVEELRGARDSSVPGVGEELLRLPQGHAPDLRPRANPRPEGQQPRILQAKLPVGVKTVSSPEHPLSHDSVLGAGCRDEKRDKAIDLVLPAVERSSPVDGVHGNSRHHEVVYDLLNCGPRSCFVVRAGPGCVPLLAHNCTQATARDVFGEGLLRVERKFPVVLHVHDEVVCEVPLADAESAKKEILSLMSQTPEWLPGCPIAAEATINSIYSK